MNFQGKTLDSPVRRLTTVPTSRQVPAPRAEYHVYDNLYKANGLNNNAIKKCTPTWGKYILQLDSHGIQKYGGIEATVQSVFISVIRDKARVSRSSWKSR
jgi:hypothetical protein